jgi:hypothetical protein
MPSSLQDRLSAPTWWAGRDGGGHHDTDHHDGVQMLYARSETRAMFD